MDLQEALERTGLTGYEARIYLALLGGGDMSGYEAAKASGISRSNVYLALGGLLEKGAVYKIDGEVPRYMPVPAEEYCDNKSRAFAGVLALIRAQAPARRSQADAYLTISGDGRITDKMCSMIAAAEKRIYVSQSERVCRLAERELRQAVSRGLRVVVVTTEPFALAGAELYHTQKEENQVRVITDSACVLTGSLQSAERPGSCLFTQNATMVTLFKEALRNEIDLIKLRSGRNGEDVSQ